MEDTNKRNKTEVILVNQRPRNLFITPNTSLFHPSHVRINSPTFSSIILSTVAVVHSLPKALNRLFFNLFTKYNKRHTKSRRCFSTQFCTSGVGQGFDLVTPYITR